MGKAGRKAGKAVRVIEKKRMTLPLDLIKSKEKLAIVVDLDYTLVNTNTTFDFLKFVSPKRYEIFSRLLRPLQLFNSIVRKRMGDIYKITLTIICCGGMSKEMLENFASAYFNKKNWTYNKNILSLLKNFQGRKFLVTASLDLIAEKFKILGFDSVISSKMLYKNGKFYRLFDLYGRKHVVISKILAQFERLIIIDDSPEPELYTMGRNVIVLTPKKMGEKDERL
jgi:phosphoserine phosphatase